MRNLKLLYPFTSIASSKSVCKSYFTSPEVKNVNKAFVYIKDFTLCLTYLHRNIRSRMRALSCDRCPKRKQKCPYKSAILDFSEERCVQNVMGRV